MIKYLKHTQINKKSWDECINQSFNGIIYAYAWYLDLIHEDWDALVEGDYERVMPLTLKTKYGITYFFQPFFAQQLGVFSKNILSPQIVDSFIRNIPKHVKIIDANFNSFNNFTDGSFEVISQDNYLLDLIQDYPKLALSYSTNIKRNLKKGIKNKLVFMTGVKPELVIDLFRNNKGKQITKWNDTNYHVIKRVMYTAIHKQAGTTCGVYDEHNELCAAAFFTTVNNRLIFLFSGTNDEARKNGAMTFLIDTMIRANASMPQILDFEGSNDSNLARFYNGFGAKKTSYSRLKINRLNFILRWILYLMV